MVTVRDSAGISIVEHTAEALERAELWTTAGQPAVRIGLAEGDPSYQFFRVSDALELADGRIVVLDEGAGQLRLYDGSGAYLTAHGRRGEGPGEYRRPVALWPLPGDSVGVLDVALMRVTVLSDRLAFGRTVRVDTLAGATVLNGEARGALLVGTTGAPSDGIAPLTLWWLRPGDPPAESLLVVPGTERVGRYWPIYGWTTRAGVAGDRLVVGTGREHEVAEYALGEEGGATLRRLIRWPGATAPVTDEDWEAYFRGYVERTRTAPENEPGLRQSLREVPVADRKPAYNEVKLDAAGNVWLRDYEFPWRLVPPETEWTVFDDEGRLRARAVLPAGFRPFEIGEDRVLGLLYDASEVQRVVVLELEKRPAP